MLGKSSKKLDHYFPQILRGGQVRPDFYGCYGSELLKEFYFGKKQIQIPMLVLKVSRLSKWMNI